jgi:hypothetical protein
LTVVFDTLTVVAVPPNPLKSFRVDGGLDGGLTVASVDYNPLKTLSLTVEARPCLGNPYTPIERPMARAPGGSAAGGALAGEEKGGRATTTTRKMEVAGAKAKARARYRSPNRKARPMSIFLTGKEVEK